MKEQMLDWRSWLHRWDVQQTRYIPQREERFTAMLDVCAAWLPDDSVVLDLACGPGAITQRLLARFPRVRVIALDYNPILLRLGRETVRADQEQVQWLHASLLQASWVEAVRDALAHYGQSQLDAVLTTTAMHWLPADVLARVYEQLSDLMREDGVYLNGDHLAYPPSLPSFRQLVQLIKEREQALVFAQPDSENYAFRFGVSIERKITGVVNLALCCQIMPGWNNMLGC